VTGSTQVKKFAGVDDFIQLANGDLLISYMGAKDLTTPGGLVEIDTNGDVIGEYEAAQSGGPVRYIPSVNGVTDTGLLAHPHGIDLRQDLGVVVTSDFADPASIAANTIAWNPKQDLGTTVRVWDISHLNAGPQKIIQVPAGRGLEYNPTQLGDRKTDRRAARRCGGLLCDRAAPGAIIGARAKPVDKRQSALSWELRAATSLCQLWHDRGRTKDALELLAPIHDRFTEGFETADLRAAKAHGGVVAHQRRACSVRGCAQLRRHGAGSVFTSLRQMHPQRHRQDRQGHTDRRVAF